MREEVESLTQTNEHMVIAKQRAEEELAEAREQINQLRTQNNAYQQQDTYNGG